MLASCVMVSERIVFGNKVYRLNRYSRMIKLSVSSSGMIE